MGKVLPAIGLGLMAAGVAVANSTLYWHSGHLAWSGSTGYYDSGHLAWSGSTGYHDSGHLAWSGSTGYYDSGHLAWSGSTCYDDSGHFVGTGSCFWSWGNGVSLSIMKANGVASCLLQIATGTVQVPCS